MFGCLNDLNVIAFNWVGNSATLYHIYKVWNLRYVEGVEEGCEG